MMWISSCSDKIAVQFDRSMSFRPPACTKDGQTKCLATAKYAALKTTDLEQMIPAGKALAGVKGYITKDSAPACQLDGETHCKSSSKFQPVRTSALAERVISGQTVAGVFGTAALPPRSCSTNGDKDCLVVNPDDKAADIAVLTASRIKLGSSIAGIAGTITPSPVLCTIDGQIDCVTRASFPAVDKVNNVQPRQASFHSSLSIGGVTGTLPSCLADGDSACLVTGSPLKAATLSGFTAADIRSGLILAGVTGTLIGLPAGCSSNGQTGCVTSNNYPALDKVTKLQGNLTKIHSSFTLLAQTGTLATCNSDGGTSCLTDSSYPSVDLVNKLQANTAKIRNNLTLIGVTGSISDCASDGASACFVNGSTYKAALLSGFAATDIKSTVTIAGVAGSATPAPANCSSDGQTSCVAVSNFPAVNKVTVIDPNIAKFHTSLTLGGVSGTLATCTSDNQTSCLASGTYPSVDKVAKAVPANYLSSLSIAGVPGTLGNCGSDGAGSCYTDGTTYKALQVSSVDATKILSSQAIIGSTGSVGNCSGSSTQSCYVTGTTYAGMSCSSNGSQNCFAQSLYYAGPTCTANSSGCYLPSYVLSSQSLKAISFDGITAGVIKSGTVIAGMTGAYPSATYPLTTGDSATELTALATQLAGSGDYGWFDRNGSRYTATGDADLLPSNIMNGVNVLGVVGNQILPADPWDVRAGVNFGVSGVGVMKYNCRNGINQANFNTDAAFASDGNSRVTTGTANDIWDTSDDYYGFASSANFPTGWDISKHFCGGSSTTASDTNVWLDTTSGGCNATFCMYKDKIAGTTWSKRITTGRTWSQAINDCASLSSEGGGWRLPTQKEWYKAYVHGLTSLSDTNFSSGDDL
ncbi:MAG: hypothetical protein EOP14_03875, partial [Pseudomonas sp.]